MTVNIYFDFATVYNIDQKVDVVLGQKFSLFTDSAEPILWATINDKVLKITEKGLNCDVEAVELGESFILIMDQTHSGIFKTLVINVLAAQTLPADALNATGEVVPKVI